MKQNITVGDLNTLTESQKQTLNSIWLPAKYDRVIASVCKDAENDIYENLEFAVGEVILGHGTSITLRRLMLFDNIIADESEIPLSNNFSESDESELSFDEPGDYFLKEDCLPLLSIGQLINFLRNSKGGRSGFSIGIPPLNDMFSDQSFTIDDKFGEVNKAEELADLLFDMLKEYL